MSIPPIHPVSPGASPANDSQGKPLAGAPAQTSVPSEDARTQDHARSQDGARDIQHAEASHRHKDHSKTLDDINRRLAESALRVEFDTTAPPNQLWLNVIDQDTGAVIQKIPPEGTRRLLEDPSAKGIVIDKPR